MNFIGPGPHFAKRVGRIPPGSKAIHFAGAVPSLLIILELVLYYRGNYWNLAMEPSGEASRSRPWTAGRMARRTRAQTRAAQLSTTHPGPIDDHSLDPFHLEGSHSPSDQDFFPPAASVTSGMHTRRHMATILSKYYEQNPNPTVHRRRDIAERERLTFNQVTGWFQRTRKSAAEASKDDHLPHQPADSWRESTATSSTLTEATSSFISPSRPAKSDALLDPSPENIDRETNTILSASWSSAETTNLQSLIDYPASSAPVVAPTDFADDYMPTLSSPTAERPATQDLAPLPRQSGPVSPLNPSSIIAASLPVSGSSRSTQSMFDWPYNNQIHLPLPVLGMYPQLRYAPTTAHPPEPHQLLPYTDAFYTTPSGNAQANETDTTKAISCDSGELTVGLPWDWTSVVNEEHLTDAVGSQEKAQAVEHVLVPPIAKEGDAASSSQHLALITTEPVSSVTGASSSRPGGAELEALETACIPQI